MKKKIIIITISTVALIILTIGIGTKMLLNYELDNELFKAVSGELIMDIGYSGHGDIKKVKDLIKQGANVNSVNKNGTTLLMRSEDLDIIQVLLEAGIDVNKQDDFGNTALMLHIDEPEIVKLLLYANADVNIKDEKGNNTLMRACREGFADTVQLILDTNKAKINETNKRGQTALMLASGLTVKRIMPTSSFLASEKGHLTCIQSLLKSNADVNIKDKTGKNALMYATQLVDTKQQDYKDFDIKNILSYSVIPNEHLQIIKLLLEQGTDINLKDKSGKTALAYTKGIESNNYPKEVKDLLNEITNLLKAAGAKE